MTKTPIDDGYGLNKVEEFDQTEEKMLDSPDKSSPTKKSTKDMNQDEYVAFVQE
jgi:hypothetical protein